MVRTPNMELIKILKSNSRIPFVAIAKKFGVSETAIRKKIKKLEKEGIIKRFTVEVDLQKLGFKIHALIGVDTTPEGYMDVISRLKSMEEIESLYSSAGDHMLLIECWFKDANELETFMKKLESMKEVKRVCPAIILEKLK